MTDVTKKSVILPQLVLLQLRRQSLKLSYLKERDMSMVIYVTEAFVSNWKICNILEKINILCDKDISSEPALEFSN